MDYLTRERDGIEDVADVVYTVAQVPCHSQCGPSLTFEPLSSSTHADIWLDDWNVAELDTRMGGAGRAFIHRVGFLGVWDEHLTEITKAEIRTAR